jgi:hypothetical protein
MPVRRQRALTSMHSMLRGSKAAELLQVGLAMAAFPLLDDS